ncbi:MAG: hypothetical protein FWH20_08275 [Oscillospiraceae bacterium]|nr:hypothetical protein [Oscillospiraceae bacterium]
MKRFLTMSLLLCLAASLMLAGCTSEDPAPLGGTETSENPVALTPPEPDPEPSEDDLVTIGNPNAEEDDESMTTLPNPNADDDDPGAITGGWSESRNLTDEDRAVFDAAMEGLVGMIYEPLSVETQIVAGTNYRFLCNATGVYPDAVTEQKYVIIWHKLDGEAEITEIYDVGGAPSEPMFSGGWTDYRALTAEDRAVFDQAMADLDGVAYVPISVATQIVAGTNYRFFCDATAVYPGAEPTSKYVTIYQDLEGNVEITNIEDLETPFIVGGYSEFRGLTDEDWEVFEEAMLSWTGVRYQPFAVATQVVSGTNYRFLCTAKDVYPGAQPTTKKVVIYKDLEGNVEITEIVDED